LITSENQKDKESVPVCSCINYGSEVIASINWFIAGHEWLRVHYIGVCVFYVLRAK